MKKEKRIKGIITMPAQFWTGIDNRIDSILISSRGDAVIDMILELKKLRPDSINFNQLVHIPLSEITQIRKELEQFKAQTRPHPQITQETLNTLLIGLGIADREQIPASLIATLLDEYRVGKNATKGMLKYREEVKTLKQRLGEVQTE